jgi:hypothetical protein
MLRKALSAKEVLGGITKMTPVICPNCLKPTGTEVLFGLTRVFCRHCRLSVRILIETQEGDHLS